VAIDQTPINLVDDTEEKAAAIPVEQMAAVQDAAVPDAQQSPEPQVQEAPAPDETATPDNPPVLDPNQVDTTPIQAQAANLNLFGPDLADSVVKQIDDVRNNTSSVLRGVVQSRLKDHIEREEFKQRHGGDTVFPVVDMVSLSRMDLSLSQMDIISRHADTGSVVGNQQWNDTLNNATYFLTPYDIDPETGRRVLREGALNFETGELNVDRLRRMKFDPKDPNRMATLLTMAAPIVGIEQPLEDSGAAGTLTVNIRSTGEKKVFSHVTAPHVVNIKRLQGMVYDPKNKKYVPVVDPGWKKFVTVFSNTDVGVRQMGEELRRAGVVDPVYMQNALDATRLGLKETSEFYAGVKNFGTWMHNRAVDYFYTNTIPALLPYKNQPVPPDVLIQDPQARAVLVAAAIVETKHQAGRPENADKVERAPDGTLQFRFEYKPYVEDLIANELDMPPEIISHLTSTDIGLTSKFSNLAISSSAGIPLEIAATRAISKNMSRAFYGWVRTQFYNKPFKNPAGKIVKITDEKTAQMFVESGIDSAQLPRVMYDFIEATTGRARYLYSSRIRNFSMNQKRELLAAGLAATPAMRAVYEQKQLDEARAWSNKADELFDEAYRVNSDGEYVYDRATRVKLLKDSDAFRFKADNFIYRTATTEQAREILKGEAYALSGAFLASHAMSSFGSPEYAGMAEFGGAMAGALLLPNMVNTLKFGLIEGIPGVKSVLGLSKAARQVRAENPELSLAQSYEVASGRMDAATREAYSFIFGNMRPDQRAKLVENMESYDALLTRLEAATDAEGLPLFEKDEIPAFVGDVFGLSALQGIFHHYASRRSAADVMRDPAGALDTDVLGMRSALSKKMETIVSKLGRAADQLEEQGQIEDGRFLRTLEQMYKEQKAQIDQDAITAQNNFKEYEQGVLSLIETGQTNVQDGTGKVILSINASDYINVSGRVSLKQYETEDGLIQVDNVLAALEDSSRKVNASLDAAIGKLEDGSVGPASTLNSGAINVNLAQRVDANKESSYQRVNASYHNFRNSNPDSRMDTFELFENLMKMEGANVSFSFGDDLQQEMSDAGVAAFSFGVGDVPKRGKLSTFFNAAAVDGYQNSGFAQLLGASDSPQTAMASMREVSSTIIEAIGDERLRELGLPTSISSPADALFLIRKALSSGAPEVLDAFGLDSVEAAKALAASMPMSTSPTQYQLIKRGLGRSAYSARDNMQASAIYDASDDLSRLAESPATGFRDPTTGEFVGAEQVQLLKDANIEFQIHMRQFENPRMRSFMDRDPAKGGAVPATVFDDLMRELDKVGSVTDKTDYLDQKVSQVFAEMFGDRDAWDPATNRFYLIQGSEAAKQAEAFLSMYGNKTFWTSPAGSRLIEMHQRGNLPYGLVIDESSLKRLSMEARQAARGETVELAQTNMENFFKFASQIPVYTRNSQTGKFEYAGPLVDVDDVSSLADPTTIMGLGLPRELRTSFGIDLEFNLRSTLNNGLDRAKRDVTESIQDQRASLETDLGSLIANMSSKVSGKTQAESMISWLKTPRALQDIDTIRKRHIQFRVSAGVDPEEAAIAFDRDLSDVLTGHLMTMATDARGSFDIARIRNNLGQNSGFRQAMEKLNPQGLAILDDIIELHDRALGRLDVDFRITGMPQNFNIDTTLNRLYATSAGRSSPRWLLLSSLVQQGRIQGMAHIRAMVQDPKLGRKLIELIKAGKVPAENESMQLASTLAYWLARDAVLYNEKHKPGVLVRMVNDAPTITQMGDTDRQLINAPGIQYEPIEEQGFEGYYAGINLKYQRSLLEKR